MTPGSRAGGICPRCVHCFSPGNVAIPLTAPADTVQTEQLIKSGLDFALMASDQNPKSAQKTMDKNVAYQYFEKGDGSKGAVSSPEPELKHGQSSSEFLSKGIRHSEAKLASLSNPEVQQCATDQKEAPVDKNVIKNPQPLRSNAFENSSISFGAGFINSVVGSIIVFSDIFSVLGKSPNLYLFLVVFRP